jgi:hypothetical protein
VGLPDGWGRVPFVGHGHQQRWQVLCGAEPNGCDSPTSSTFSLYLTIKLHRNMSDFHILPQYLKEIYEIGGDKVLFIL